MAILTKRVQVLFSEDQWQQLAQKAAEREKSVASLIREAVEQTYFSAKQKSIDEKLAVIEEMSQMNLNVDDWEVMKQEIISRYDQCLEGIEAQVEAIH